MIQLIGGPLDGAILDGHERLYEVVFRDTDVPEGTIIHAYRRGEGGDFRHVGATLVSRLWDEEPCN